jgi:hypothetical protein
MSDDTIAVFVKLEYWEIYWANLIVLWRAFRISLIVAVSMALLVGFSAVERLQNPSQTTVSQILQDFEVPALVCLFIAALIFGPMLIARRALADGRVNRGTTYQFTENSIHVETAVATADIQWAAFRYAVGTRSLLLLLATKTGGGAQILPTRCFANESDLAAVRQLISRKVPK